MAEGKTRENGGKRGRDALADPDSHLGDSRAVVHLDESLSIRSEHPVRQACKDSLDRKWSNPAGHVSTVARKVQLGTVNGHYLLSSCRYGTRQYGPWQNR